MVFVAKSEELDKKRVSGEKHELRYIKEKAEKLLKDLSKMKDQQKVVLHTRAITLKKFARFVLKHTKYTKHAKYTK